MSIIGSNSQVSGKLEVNIEPVDEDGLSEIPDEMIPENPMELVNQRIDFNIIISKVSELPSNFCKDVYVEYTFYLNNEIKYQTEVSYGKAQEKTFNFKKHHTVEVCTEHFINYLLNEQICFKVYGLPDIDEKEV